MMDWVDEIAHQEHMTFLIGLGIGLFMTILAGIGAYTHGQDNMQEKMQQEAVEAGKAYWCIEDHKQVFSWEECE